MLKEIFQELKVLKDNVATDNRKIQIKKTNIISIKIVSLIYSVLALVSSILVFIEGNNYLPYLVGLLLLLFFNIFMFIYKDFISNKSQIISYIFWDCFLFYNIYLFFCFGFAKDIMPVYLILLLIPIVLNDRPINKIINLAFIYIVVMIVLLNTSFGTSLFQNIINLTLAIFGGGFAALLYDVIKLKSYYSSRNIISNIETLEQVNDDLLSNLFTQEIEFDELSKLIKSNNLLLDYEAVIHSILGKVLTTYNASRVSFYNFFSDKIKLVNTFCDGNDNNRIIELNVDTISLITRDFREGRIVKIFNIEIYKKNNKKLYYLLKNNKTNSLIIIPMYNKKILSGMLCIRNPRIDNLKKLDNHFFSIVHLLSKIHFISMGNDYLMSFESNHDLKYLQTLEAYDSKINTLNQMQYKPLISIIKLKLNYAEKDKHVKLIEVSEMVHSLIPESNAYQISFDIILIVFLDLNKQLFIEKFNKIKNDLEMMSILRCELCKEYDINIKYIKKFKE